MLSYALGSRFERFTAGTERAQRTDPPKNIKFLAANDHSGTAFSDVNRFLWDRQMHTPERKQTQQQRIFYPIAASRLDKRRKTLCALSVSAVLSQMV